MIEATPWLERQFETGLPVGRFPAVLERLRGTPARIEDRLRGADSGRIATREGAGWSVLENVGHLIQVEELWAARIDDFEARRDTLTSARFESGRVDQARFNSRTLADLWASFRAARGRLVGRLEGIDPRLLDHVAAHPRLGRSMRIVDLMVFIAEHDDHHLAAMTRLLGPATRSGAIRPA